MKDVQNENDSRGIDIQKVGIKGLDLPLTIQRKNASNQVVSAAANVNVALPSRYKGTHMSRFVEVLSEWKNKNLLGVDVQGCLKSIVKKLNAKSGELEFNFKYFIDKPSPVTKIKSPMSYDCSFTGELNNFNTEKESYRFLLGVKVPIITLCPCSKEISDYGAHNQRAIVSVKISYDKEAHIWLEDLIAMIESCASCDIYPLLKRVDEKFVTEKAFDNPKFVEDVIRDIIINFRKNPIIRMFEVECESFESIHTHSAWAYQKEEN